MTVASCPIRKQFLAPNPVGWGYTSLKGLLDMMTIHFDRQTPDTPGDGPLFIDETGLPSSGETLEEIKKHAITMEMPKGPHAGRL